MKTFTLFFLFLIFGSYTAFSQDVTQLKKQLSVAKTDTARVRLLNEISASFFTSYEYDSCKYYAIEALNGATLLKNNVTPKKNPAYELYCKKLYAKAIENMGCSMMYVNTRAALDTFLVAAKLWGETGDKNSLAYVFQRIGDTYSNQNNYINSIAFYNKSLRLYQQTNNREQIANSFYNIALTQRAMSNFGDALENNIHALGIAKEIKDSVFIVECYLSNGFIYMLAKDFPSAMKNQQTALQIASIINDSDFIATAYSDMGNTNMRAGNLDAAYKNFTTALDIRKRQGVDLYMSSNLLYISNILAKQKKYKEAINTNFESLAYAKQLQDGRFIIDSYGELANNFLIINDTENAFKYFDTLYQVSTEYKDNYRRSSALQGKADVYLLQNKLQNAINTLQQALSITDTVDYRSLEDVYNRLSNAYEKSGDYKKAYFSSLQLKRYGDSVSSIEKSEKLTSLTNQLEFQNKRALLKASQDKQLAVQQAEIKRQKLVRNITIIGLIIVVVLAIIFFKRLREKRKMNIQLEQMLADLKITQAQLVQSEKMASLGELTAGIAHEIQNPLNFVNNFSELNKEIIAEMKCEIEKGNYETVKLIANDIEANEEKINHHGKRAEAIVKGMLHHSRKSTGQKELTDINALCDEYLRLAFHGLRAKDKTFNAKFESNFDASIPKINIVPQDFGRVILNLINNAFYAVSDKQKHSDSGYQPTVIVSTKRSDNQIIIKVKDNANGIPQNVLDKIFQPFFTTKPTGQGTGLGLSLSYDIIKAHNGEIKVETKDGEGTEFIVSLSV